MICQQIDKIDVAIVFCFFYFSLETLVEMANWNIAWVSEFVCVSQYLHKILTMTFYWTKMETPDAILK